MHSQCEKEALRLRASERREDIQRRKILTNLETLWLEGNQITDVSFLATLTRIELLAIGENPLSERRCPLPPLRRPPNHPACSFLRCSGGYGVPEDPWSFEYEIAVPKARISTPAVPFPSLRPRAKAAVSIRTLMIVS